MNPKRPLTAEDRKQQLLAQYCYWDEAEQILWIDCRKIFPALGVVSVPSWDAMMMLADEIPEYPSHLKVLQWSNFSQLATWRKQIPKWVQESCSLFPTHQLKLLHYAGKYPQILELLDHTPLLAWRLIQSGLSESQIVALFSGKRQQMAEQVGWPGKEETVKFLRNLRLRWVNDDIAQQIEVCLLDDSRLTALQSLPRINSMALSLAASFPELIGSKLHHALAQLPCRPMQCKSMVALLQDAYDLADKMQLSPAEKRRIGLCRYLSDVTAIYQAWLKDELLRLNPDIDKTSVETLQWSAAPKVQPLFEDWLRLSFIQQHAWWLDYPPEKGVQLVAWQDSEGIWGALLALDVLTVLDASKPTSAQTHQAMIRIRGLENALPGAKQLTDLHLWQARLIQAGR